MAQRDGNNNKNNNFPPMANGGQFAPNPYQPVPQGYPNQQGMPPQGGFMPNGPYPQMIPMNNSPMGYGAPNQPVMPQGGFAPNSPYPPMMPNNNVPAPNRYPPRQPAPNGGRPPQNNRSARPADNNAASQRDRQSEPKGYRAAQLSVDAPKTTGFDDRPAEADKFSIQGYIKGLNNFIKVCSTPMTLSIQGSWGTGKTSIMQFIKKPLDEDSKIKTVWFNTWQYSQFNMDNLLAVSLLSGIIESLEIKDDSSKKKFRKVVNVLGRAISSAALIGIEALAGSQAAEMVSNAEKKVSARDDADLYDPARAIRELRAEFAGCVKKACDEGHLDKIVIFVDDLDRLEPRKAVELLEVLKLFMDCDKCVFVLAIDYEVVCRGVAAKYGKLADSDEDALEKGRSFFDKIIQVPFKVPVANYNIRDYISDLFKQIGISNLGSDAEWYESVIKNSIGTNPRAIKRLFNSFQLLKYIEDATGTGGTYKMNWTDKTSVKMLFASLCLQHSGENIYNYIVINANNYVRLAGSDSAEMSDASKNLILSLCDSEKTYEDITRSDSEFGDTVSEKEYTDNKNVLTMLKETVTGGSDRFDDFVGTLTLTAITSTKSTEKILPVVRMANYVRTPDKLHFRSGNTAEDIEPIMKAVENSLGGKARKTLVNYDDSICVIYQLSQELTVRIFEKTPGGFYVYLYGSKQKLKPELYEDELKDIKKSAYYSFDSTNGKNNRLRVGIDNGNPEPIKQLEKLITKLAKNIEA